jgi:signal transduction histidine kinase
MLKRGSLALRVYGYAIVAFVVVAALLNWTFEAIRSQDQPERMERFASRVSFLAKEVMRAGPGSPAAARRLIELEAGTGVDLTYISWQARNDYPATLATHAFAVTNTDRRNPFTRIHWARIDSGGQPVGALRIEFLRQFGRRRSSLPWSGPVTILGILALLIIPPLVIWVVRPIRRLEAAAHRLGDGDLETPIVLKRNDELGRLAQAFDGMRERLRRMLHERERLLTDVSHEIRGPLARMAIAQELLETDVGDNPYVARLRREMQHLDQLTGELLSLSRERQGQPPQWADVAVGDLIRRLIKDRDLIARQQQQTFALEIAETTLHTDADLLARALGNLLDNALKYSGPGGKVTISHRDETHHVQFTIRDNGPGIPAEALPHIFEPFYRPDVARTRTTGGTGLGLAIVRSIVDRLNGTIALDSQEGVGTTVTVRLPRKV